MWPRVDLSFSEEPVVAATSPSFKRSYDCLWWSTVTSVSIDTSPPCWVEWMNTMSVSAAARAAVLGKKSAPAKIILWQRPVSQTLVQWRSTRRGGRWVVLLYFGSPNTDIFLSLSAIYCFFFHVHTIWHSNAVVQALSLIALWLSRQAAVLFIQVCQKTSVTLSHPPMCEWNHTQEGPIHQKSIKNVLRALDECRQVWFQTCVKDEVSLVNSWKVNGSFSLFFFFYESFYSSTLCLRKKLPICGRRWLSPGSRNITINRPHLHKIKPCFSCNFIYAGQWRGRSVSSSHNGTHVKCFLQELVHQRSAERECSLVFSSY